MTDAQFLELFNRLASQEMFGNYTPITHFGVACEDAGLDSMAWMMVGFWFCTWFGVDNEVSKLLHPVFLKAQDPNFLSSGACATISEMREFLEHHGKRPDFGQCLADLSQE